MIQLTKQSIQQSIYSEYESLYNICKQRHVSFSKYLSGGNTKSLSYFKPFPIHIEKGKGAYVYTPEGHKLLDVVNCYGSLIHGHAPPKVHQLVQKSLKNSTLFAAPTIAQYEAAQLSCNRVKSIEKIRFCCSGTEATLFALRAARFFTKKNKFLKFYGGYHGSHDSVCVAPEQDFVTGGIPPGVRQDVIQIEFNDFDALEMNIKKYHDCLAAVIMEPFLGAGGTILPKKGFVKFVRQITKKYDVLLIMDEVLSFRIHPGGAQEFYEIDPDLTTLGKFIGGGFPLSAFGGRNSIMDIFDATKTAEPLSHSGSFYGYETALIAGSETLKMLGEREVEHLNNLGSLFNQILSSHFNKTNYPIKINQIGSVANIHITDQHVTNFSIIEKTNKQLLQLLHLALLNRKIHTTPRGMYFFSTIMDEKQVKWVAQNIIECLEILFSETLNK